jgi:hypothetical protein
MSLGLQIGWFKRDLRTADHAPLSDAAASGNPVLCLWIYEPSWPQAPEFDASHLEFANECLESLDRSLRLLGNRLVTRVDYSHESNTPINNGLPTFNRALGNTRLFEREVNLVNASATLALNNGLELGVFARNLLDDRYILTVFDGVAQSGTVSGYPSPPRTYGGLVRFRF